MHRGLFLGLTTLDIIYRVEQFPSGDEKIVASGQLVAAGGPATNAAVTFAFLGGRSTLASVIGGHPLTRLIRDDLTAHGVRLADLSPDHRDVPGLSSIMVKASTGERSIVYTLAQPVDGIPGADLLQGADVVLVDGHQMKASLDLCFKARSRNIPCVLDGESWNALTEELLRLIDYAICSEQFLPPGCSTMQDVIERVSEFGVKHIAVSRGGKPIVEADNGRVQEISVAQESPVVDTLGAGDILHGAFCHSLILSKGDFHASLVHAAQIASFSCRYFGTRQWMKEMNP